MMIKYWDVEQVMVVLVENGFSVESYYNSEFSGAGSNYFLKKKNSPAQYMALNNDI